MTREFPKLFKYTTTGKVQQWQVFVDGDGFYTEEGLQGGVITKSLPTVCKPKNVGKRNETTPEAQALLEAEAKFTKKKESHYNETLQTERSFLEPMLARDAKESKDLDFKQRTFIQPKLDGLRCLNQENSLMSRNGKPYITCPHLYQDEVLLDGELYTHLYHDDFNKIVSLCKRGSPNEQELLETKEKVEFWVYDYPSHPGVFSERYEALKTWLSSHKNPSIKLVPTYEVKNMDEINTHHGKFIEEGYEGSIIRIDLGPYENKRSKQLLKYKDFIDEEYTINDVIEGEGGRANTVGALLMSTKDGRTFKSNVKGTHQYLKELLVHKRELIGKTATVKYFMLTPDGIPRFPFVTKINRDSFE